MTAQPPDFDSRYFRSALGRFATGVTVITAETREQRSPLGMTISSFNSVSLAPPLVLWTLSKTATSLLHFQQTERYVIHVLSAQQLHLARKFSKGSQAHRFEGVPLTRSPHGALMLDDPHCTAWFECHNHSQVERCHRRFGQPLVYHAGDFDLTPSADPLPAT